MTLEEAKAKLAEMGIVVKDVYWTEGASEEERTKALAESIKRFINGEFKESTFNDEHLLEKDSAISP